MSRAESDPDRVLSIWKSQSEKSLTKNQKLCNFQLSILKCFLDNCPNLEYLVYSTCSIFPSENELVVQNLLEYVNSSEELTKSIELVDLMATGDFCKGFEQEKLKQFGVNNSSIFLNTERCLRAFPFTKKHDGFFVALFKINK